jgi:hypothetical protein
VNSSFPFLKETLKSFTFKTSIDLISMPKLIIYWLWYKTRATAEWLPLLHLVFNSGINPV